MEVQPTDFENAAYSIFIVLLTRAILSFGLNFYIPISKVGPSSPHSPLQAKLICLVPSPPRSTRT